MSTNTTTAHITSLDAERFRGAVFFRITVRRWGNRAKIKDASKLIQFADWKKEQLREQAELGQTTPRTTGADNYDITGSGVTATKRLMKSAPLDDLNEFLTETKEKLVGRFGIMTQSRIQPGLFLCSIDNVQTVEDELETAVFKIQTELVPAFAADFAAAIDRAQHGKLADGGMGPLFDAADYPTVEEVCQCFAIEWNWLSLSVPEGLPPQLRQAAAEKLERQFAEAADEVKLALREGFQGLIAHAADKLKPTEDGEKHQFKNSLTENLIAFCDTFNARNVMGDAELAALVERARTVITGIETGGKATADVLRKDATVRENVAAQFGEIAQTLGGMIETERSRQFSFEE